MNTYPETPDNWIERQPEDYGPQRDDACMVCDKIDCVCPTEPPTCAWIETPTACYLVGKK